MTPESAGLIVLIQRYLGGLMDPFVTVQEARKLLYFLREAERPPGAPLREGAGLDAENLALVPAELGEYLDGVDVHSNADAPLQLTRRAETDSQRCLESNAATRRRVERVANLIDGFETGFGLDLLYTVHRFGANDKASTPDDVVSRARESKICPGRFSERQLRLAHRVLVEQRWLRGVTREAPDGDR